MFPKTLSRLNAIGTTRRLPLTISKAIGEIPPFQLIFIGGTTVALAYLTYFAIREFRRARKPTRVIGSFKERLEKHREYMIDLEETFRKLKDDLEKLNAEGPRADQDWKRELKGHCLLLAKEVQKGRDLEEWLQLTIDWIERTMVRL
jgi:hypothetical protein